MTISEYLDNLNRHYKTGISTEHTYRGDLQSLLESMAHGVQVTNEPSRVACGAPDYILTRKNIPVGYIEAKDIGIDLKGKTLQEQINRYRASLDNLIIQNADPSKEIVAIGQTYFAVQTRLQEIGKMQEYVKLNTENENGCYAIFRNYGSMGLYGLLGT
jgi:hypothetical protein